jgi:hypothetical protein
MSLTAGQIPKVANVLNGNVGLIVSGSNIVTLGSNTNGVTTYTAGVSGSRVISMMGSTDDTVTVNVFVYILRSATVIPIGMVNIPLSSGNTNAARFPVDFLNGTNLPGLPVDNTGRQYISLLPNDVLRVGSLATLSSAKTCYVSTHGLDYQT